jgi:hypothetical protein
VSKSRERPAGRRTRTASTRLAEGRFARNRASGYNSIQGDARSSQQPHLQVGFPVHGSLNDKFAPFVGPDASNLKIWMSKNS